jgi:GNAT superfamily N-acetyltransferase
MATIRPATILDVPVLQQLYAAWVAGDVGYPHIDAEEHTHFSATIIRHLALNPDFAIFLALADDTTIVGFVGLEVLERVVGKPHRYALGHWLYVVPVHRHAGVAAQLIEAAMLWCRSKQVPVIELTALDREDGWARRGFIPFLTAYYLPVETCLVQSQARLIEVPNGLSH